MTEQHSFWRTPQGWAAMALIGGVSYFLLMEHRTHLFYALPFLIFLLCPAMHLFMHGGHGGHKHDEQSSYDHGNMTENDAYRGGLEDGRKHSKDGRPVDGGR